MKFKNIKKQIFMITVFTIMMATTVWADDADLSSVTNGIDVLKNLVLSVIGGVGVIFLGLGLLDFGTAYSDHNSTGQMTALKKVIGGLIIIAVPTLIGILTT